MDVGEVTPMIGSTAPWPKVATSGKKYYISNAVKLRRGRPEFAREHAPSVPGYGPASSTKYTLHYYTLYIMCWAAL